MQNRLRILYGKKVPYYELLSNSAFCKMINYYTIFTIYNVVKEHIKNILG